ncbi:hypothetical protein C2G38_2182351 [Gigaspora rosea]|uniref:Uncharacterized protein n=1 Tax=Gigaspora rosea TaxID=44941 RepID=A0A397VC21_9GLOM|nr:hypothetical protein C2G38_2182351 [Gigaspora rosea]
MGHLTLEMTRDWSLFTRVIWVISGHLPSLLVEGDTTAFRLKRNAYNPVKKVKLNFSIIFLIFAEYLWNYITQVMEIT